MPVPAGFTTLFSTDDRAVAEGLGRSLLGPHRLRDDDQPGFWASAHTAEVGSATLASLACGRRTELVLLAPPRFLVIVPGRGRAVVRIANRCATATARVAVVLPPGAPASICWPAGTSHLVVALDGRALLRHLSRLLDRPLDHPLSFEMEMDLACAAARRWNLAIELLHAELAEPRSLLRTGVGVGQLEDLVMGSLLYGHRSSYSTALRLPAQNGGPGATRMARDFIDAHLREPLSVAAVAAACGVSARTLQATFQSELQTTPTTYIRTRRLERVRADLSDHRSGSQATVTEVAGRWGITHLGRFAAEYRSRFGESPSQTLRR
ncbi:MAG: AraC family transcriptional regulator [Acidimicrobiales bacterium]